jgi:hypothetical protein
MEEQSESQPSRRTLLRTVGGTLSIAGVSALAGCNERGDRGKGQMTSSPASTGDGVPTGPDTPSPTPESGVGVGVYLGSETALEPWEAWFGRKVDLYSFAMFHETWEDYRMANWPLEMPLKRLRDGRRLIVSFEMYPDEVSMDRVAAGRFNEQYRALALDLVEAGLGDAYLRFGWEFNGQWAEDGAVGRPDQYVAAWKSVVGAMRNVPGARFEFVWAPDIWRRQLDPPRAYPGDHWVDALGLTMYDKGDHYPFPPDCNDACVRRRRKRTWRDLVRGRESHFGLEFWASFARQHDKELVFPEYGVTAREGALAGGGDNPLFFEWFSDWMSRNNDIVGWHNLWSWTRGPHYLGPPELKAESEFPAHPEASRIFRRLFGPGR